MSGEFDWATIEELEAEVKRLKAALSASQERERGLREALSVFALASNWRTEYGGDSNVRGYSLPISVLSYPWVSAAAALSTPEPETKT